MQNKSGQNDDFNPFKSAPKAERANITARGNNTAPMVFCVFIYVIIFRLLSFVLSFDVIIFHGQQMLSFLCYHFPCTYFVLSFMLSFDVIIYCYHFPPFIFFLKT